DEDARYCQVIEIDVENLEPVIAYPFLPSNGHSVSQAVIAEIRVDQVFIGSCTNGRLSDFEVAANILKDKKVAIHVRLILTRGTQQILREATKKGYIDTLVVSGAVVSNPTCGACLGGYMGILGDDEVCISTTNRNFVGRMGS
ncbi:3-isopropylmalate dehydratase large subunit, partial [Arcobacter venerupis]|uniref:aconitase family protein n=1 Tax=Arcobacter venerupis TaxID=1054033 RepID=UPI00100660E3